MHLASGDISLNTFAVLIFLWWCSALWCSIYRSDLILALISDSICDLSTKLEKSSLEIGKDCSHWFPYNRGERWSMTPDGKETLDWVPGHKESFPLTPILSQSVRQRWMFLLVVPVWPFSTFPSSLCPLGLYYCILLYQDLSRLSREDHE